MSTFENLLIGQTEKQMSLLFEQSRHFAEWHETEHELIDRFVAQECFVGGAVSAIWEGAAFRNLEGYAEVGGKWSNLAGSCAAEGLYLTNRIVRCKEPVRLRTLAAEIKIEFRLSGESELWVMTRGSGVDDPKACILKVTRELDVDGTFIVFGSPIGEENDFVFFKRQQIPEEDLNPTQEVSNIEIKIKDNGDDRVFVSIRMETLKNTVFQTFCNKFLPALTENKIMLAGSGRNLILRKVSIQQKERSSMGIIIEASKRQQCCQIF